MHGIRSTSGLPASSSIHATPAPAALDVQDADPLAQRASDRTRRTPRDTPAGTGGAMPGDLSGKSDAMPGNAGGRSDAMDKAVLYRAVPPDRGQVPALVRRGAGDAITPPAFPNNEAIAKVLASLTAITRPAEPPGWQPIPQLADSLDALFQCARHASSSDKAALRIVLAHMMLRAEDHHRNADVDLLTTVVDGIMAGRDPAQMLGGIAERSLNLPNFKIRPDDQPEPPQRHFTSTLLPFAAAAYDYGPLGRTLLLEGARACFAGPNQAQRVEKLQEAMFALPNPPASGEPLASMADIWAALRERGIDV